MANEVETLPGDTAGKLMFRYFGRDDDELEEAFWRVNPKLLLRQAPYPAGIVVKLPDVPPVQVKKVVTAWD